MIDIEELRELLSRISKAHTVADIAKEIGVPPGALYDFQSRGSMGPERREALTRWMSEHGYLQEGVSMSQPRSQTGELSALARELRSVADYLESAMPVELRIERFCSLIASYNPLLDRIRKLGEEIKDRGTA